MIVKMEQALTDLKHGDHICLIYENASQQITGAVSFLRAGLAQGERCLYVANDRAIATIAQALDSGGVDVKREQERGALRMLSGQDSYLDGGKFDPETMIGFWRRSQEQALADGFSGLRGAGEMTWALGPEIGSDRLIKYEVLLNGFLASSRSTFLCEYNRRQFDPAVIHDVLRTHPIAVLGDLVCPNPYYEPPELLLSPAPQASAEFKAKRVGWWIAQLKRARAGEQDRERARRKLEQSERRLAEAQQVAHIGSWERDLVTNEVTWSDETYRLFGLRPHNGHIPYQQFLSLVLPQDAARIRALVEDAVRERRPFDCDYRITRADGGMRVIHDRGTVILNDDGAPIRLVGTAQDVTERKRAERALEQYADGLQALSRRLVEVQEEERRHLARELHDEFGQILATITLHVHAARGLAGDAARPRLEECAALLKQAGEQVRRLALELRPTMLDTLGLEPALRWLAEQHEQRTSCAVQVTGHLCGTRSSPDVAIACFRVAQEALTNVVRHAAAKHIQIELRQSDDLLELIVLDDGIGFDVASTREQAARQGRLGLLGMAERVQLLGGKLDVASEPGRGARIRATFPLGGTLAESLGSRE